MIRVGNILVVFALLFAGCSTVPLQKARTDFFAGNLARADNTLGECTDTPERNRLLCYMEKGIILHYMKSYEESTGILLKVSQFVKDQDQVSITEQSEAVMINDMATTYKGEYSERLWIHTFLMMNFLLQYRYESALVEAKQALEVYDEHPDSLKEDYYTRALIALCFENMNLPDDARIEYEKLKEEMGSEIIKTEPIAPGKGELILFIGQGRIPEKIPTDIVVPPSIRISVPRYESSSIPSAPTISADGNAVILEKITTDMGEVARKSLNDRAAQYLTRQALRAGSKEAIAQKIGKNSEFGEVLSRIVLFLLEEADIRSWETLPGSMTLARVILDTGKHNLEISSENSGTLTIDDIDIPEGRRVYRSIRF